jgi:hypothetical protein
VALKLEIKLRKGLGLTHPVVPDVGIIYAALLLFERSWIGFDAGWRELTNSSSIDTIIAIVPSNDSE